MPFTITETNIQFFDDYDSGDFTTTGPLCPAGTFIDTYRALAGIQGKPGVVTVLTETVYTHAPTAAAPSTCKSTSAWSRFRPG